MIAGYFITAVVLIARFVKLAILIEIILSWVMMGKSNAFTEFIKIFTSPFLTPGRVIQEKIMPGLMIDFSPIFGVIFVDLLERVLISAIKMLLM